MNFSEQQNDIFSWVQTGSGNLVIEARAGTGKTTTVIEAARFMKGSVFFGAFNKSIAVELGEKIISNGLPETRIKSGTLHSIGFRAWKALHPEAKVNGGKTFSILDSILKAKTIDYDEKSILMKNLPRFLSFAKYSLIFPENDSLQDFWDSTENPVTLPEDMPVLRFLEIALLVLTLSIEKSPLEVDFDDMLYMPLIENLPIPKSQWIIIDEAQDLNAVRRELSYRMLTPSGRFIAVGDPAQAIYAFAGANSDSLDIVRRDLKAETLLLNTTYRCPSLIVAEASHFVPDFFPGPDNKTGEVLTMTKKEFLKDLSSNPLNLSSGDVILCRKNRPNISIAFQLLNAEIPCFVEGRDIGKGLIDLANKWKRITNLADLEIRLEEFLQTETAKFLRRKQNSRIEDLRDRVDSLQIFIDKVLEEGGSSLYDLEEKINSIFIDTTTEKPKNTLILSSVHKSKGKEWPRVFLLGRDEYMPSPMATSEEELQQENNLIYVAITRSMNTLVYVNTLVDEDEDKDNFGWGKLLAEEDYIDPNEEVNWREHQKEEN